ncbi:CHAD domain-containing protein [Parvularcula sp. LCG005]|uniref:CHAD domain-containing protein n=1 Tax=Parvularcula sp. LCG005 TaxID=3078805 RepID=UPI002941E213|nr:CHAD domain-containing protein [Parvularcula sp. LCG005]WOI54557.1 CHAD domain-containing protein [Parvularcula sp. LCG005]
MAFLLPPVDGPVSLPVKKLARRQLSKVLADLDHPSRSDDRKAYLARRRLKKVRALIHLVEGSLVDFDEVDARLQGASRALSPLRDAGAAIEVLARLYPLLNGLLTTKTCVELHEAVVGQRIDLSDKAIADAMASARASIQTVVGGIGNWSVTPDTHYTLLDGLRQTYRMARRRLRKAIRTGTDEDLHDWRRMVKYHRCHCRLMQERMPVITDTRRHSLAEVSRLLGHHQDLIVLEEVLAAAGMKTAISGFIEGEKAGLRERALKIGAPLFDSKPKAFSAVLYSSSVDSSTRKSPSLT